MWILRPIRLKNCAHLRQFILRLVTQYFVVKLIVALFLAFVLQDIDNTEIIVTHPLAIIVIFVFVVPIVETLLLQTFMIELSRRLRYPISVQFCAGMIPFALLHFQAGIATGIAAGVIGGVFFSYAYLECRGDSWWKATGVTCVTHHIHNVICTPIMYAMASFV